MVKELIEQSAKEIEDAIALKIGMDVGEEILGHGQDLSALQSLSATCVAESKKLLAIAKGLQMQELKKYFDKPMLLKQIVESNVIQEQALYDKCERLDSAIRHKLDFLRSALSLYKATFQEEISHRQFNGK